MKCTRKVETRHCCRLQGSRPKCDNLGVDSKQLSSGYGLTGHPLGNKIAAKT